MDAKLLGAAVRHARQLQGLTHSCVSREAGVSVQFLVDLEKGKPTLQLDKALATARFFGIKLSIGVDTVAADRYARFAAIEKKERADRKLLEFHQAIVDKLRARPETEKRVLSKALAQVELWEREEVCSPEYISRWRSALDGGADAIQAKVLNERSWAKALVQNSPFGFMARKGALRG